LIGSDRSWYIYWSETDEKTAIETIRTALDLGINWIDTAPFYGWGRAEKIVGKALKGRREDAFIFTKCGTIHDQAAESHMDLRPETIRREVDESLARLQTDHIDLYQMHDVDEKTPIEDSWREMYKLIDEGKVRYAGLSNPPHPTRRARHEDRPHDLPAGTVQPTPQRDREILPFPFATPDWTARMGIIGLRLPGGRLRS